MKNTSKYMALALGLALLAGCSTAGIGSDSQSIDLVKETDTEPPVITFKKDKLEVKVGESFDVPANIKVVDDTDGNLKEVEKIEDGKAGYVIDDDKIDLTKAGTYTVSVTAVDSAGNKAKESFTVKVTEDKEEADTKSETKSEEVNKAESKSESSSGNSSAKSSSSASNSSANKNTGSSSSSASSSNKTNSSSTGSNNSVSSNSGTNTAAKPSTGSGSSASSSTAKPSTGNATSSGSSGSTTKPACKDVVVVDREAWDEQVLVKEAYDEQILVKEAWDETIVDKPAWSEVVVVEPEYGVIHCRCGLDFYDLDTFNEHFNSCDSGGYWSDVVPAKTAFVDHPAETHTVHHDAEYRNIHHDAEYKTVHHDAVTHVVQVCS